MWFILALGSAVCFALHSATAKRARQVHPLWVGWTYVVGSVPCYAIYAWLVAEPVVPTDAMIQYVVISAVANFFALPAFFYAVQEGELSIVMPLSVLSPAFALVVEAVLYGEFPPPLAIAGVLAIVVGAFLLHAARGEEVWWAPLRRLVDDRAARKMMLATLAWGIAASADRGGVRASTAITYAVVIHCSIGLVMLPLLFRAGSAQARAAIRGWRSLVAPTLFGAAMIVFQMVAMQEASASMVIALKRMAALIAILIGAVAFAEQGWQRRITAATIMVVGAVMIGASG